MDKVGGTKAVISREDRREEMCNSGRVLSQLSLSSFLSFLERVEDAMELYEDHVYAVFTFGPIPSLHYGISIC